MLTATVTLPLAFRAPARDDWTLVVVLDRTDEQLLNLVAQGDRDAFEQLYERFSRPIFSLCVRLLTDRGQAEDAAQEAFSSVWRHARSFDAARGSAIGWLFAIARNAATDLARRRVARPTDALPETADPGLTPDAEAVRDDEAFRVHAAIGLLAEREREVIELAYFDGLSQSEIADRLAIPLGTVKTRTRAALRRLAGELAEGGAA